MAIVVVIIGLFIASGLAAYQAVSGTSGQTQTRRKLEHAEKMLALYVIEHGCLPCPANGTLATSNANAGLATRSTGTTYSGTGTAGCLADGEECTQANGVLPWRNLGLREEEVTDGWGSRFRYIVASAATWTAPGAPGTTCPEPDRLAETLGMVRCGVQYFPTGNISVLNADTDSATGETTTAAYAIISSGPDKSLAINQSTGTVTSGKFGQTATAGTNDFNEAENTDGDAVVIWGNANDISGVQHFDDLVRVGNAATLILRCGPGACGNPS
jgi:type II secretory pathway pseudopilin PulG